MDEREFEEAVERMRAVYRAKLPAKADHLASLLDGDGGELVSYLHKLGGTAGSYGLDEIAQPALALEAELKAGAGVDQLRERLVALIATLRG